MKGKSIFVLFAVLLTWQLGEAQCDTLRHNMTWFDGWISCQESQSPNPARGVGHWIYYDFGQQYSLNELHVWNMNAKDYLGYGLQNVVIDVSTDGQIWTEVGQYVIPQAPGLSDYEGIDAMDFDSTIAQHVLITAIDNYGGDCYGLSEVRFRAHDLCQGDAIKWIAGNGSWSEPSNWCKNKIPTATDDVVIPAGITVTVPAYYTAYAHNVQLETGAEIDLVGRLIVSE